MHTFAFNLLFSGKAAEAYGSLDFDTLGDFIMKYVVSL